MAFFCKAEISHLHLFIYTHMHVYTYRLVFIFNESLFIFLHCILGVSLVNSIELNFFFSHIFQPLNSEFYSFI